MLFRSAPFLAVIAIIFMVSCATGYKPVHPSFVSYHESKEYDGIGFSYQYDVLHHAGNKKYAKRERKKNVRVVAVKITNNTGNTIHPSADLEIMSRSGQVPLLNPVEVRKELRQNVPVYLLYLLFTPMTFTVSSGTDNNVYPIGLVLGPGLTAYNMIRAGNANKKLQEELENYSLDKPLAHGQSMYALIGFNSPGYDALEVRVKR